jgi:quercetin dioxygenase-like cupin family protein
MDREGPAFCICDIFCFAPERWFPVLLAKPLREEIMPVIKYDDIKRDAVLMDGVRDTSKANVIGPEQGWSDCTLRVFRIEPGGYTPLHQHDWEHVNYVVKGSGTLTIADETFDLSEKDFAFVPPNTKHQFRNTGDQPFEFICIVPERGAY